MSRASSKAFWDFSLRVYALPGVAPACLALQDGAGADVNVLLFCCWAGAAGAEALDETDIRAAAAATAEWCDEVVRPLRALRRRLKPGFEGVPAERSQGLRQAVQAIEIDAEHIEQLLLAETIPLRLSDGITAPARAGLAAANLAAYLELLGVERGDAMRRHCAALLGACFSELEGAEVAAALAAGGFARQTADPGNLQAP